MLAANGIIPQLRRQSTDDLKRDFAQPNGLSGGKGKGLKGKRPRKRLMLISRKVPQLGRHGGGIRSQRDGFVSLREMLNRRDMRQLGATWEYVDRIVYGRGSEFKKRIELGRTGHGETAIRHPKDIAHIQERRPNT